MGKDLVESLVLYSGLPENYVRARLEGLIASEGYSVDTLTVDQVRELAANLLQDIILNEASFEC